MLRNALNRVRDRLLQPKLQSAHSHLRDGRAEEADAILTRILDSHPAQPDALHMKGVAAHVASRYEAARDYYEQAIMVAPDFPDPYPGLAAVLARIGAPGELAAFVDHALGTLGERADTLTAMAAHLIERAPAEAVRLLDAATAIDPSSVAARCGRATLLARTGDIERAVEEARALLAESSDPLAIRAAAAVAHVGGARNAAALEIGRRLVALPGATADEEYNRMVLLERLEGRDAALAACDRLVERNPAHALARFYRASLRLGAGDFAGGWADYESRRDVDHVDTIREEVLPAWDGSPLGERTIVISDEQGLGDSIMFSRFLHDLRAREPGARIVFACYSSLYPWYAAQPALERVKMLRIEARNDWSSADCHAPLGSLPHLLGLRAPIGAAPPPYLEASPALASEWEARLPPRRPGRLRVGLVWAANPRQGVGRQRSIPPDDLAPLLAVPGVDWVSLQVGVAPPLPTGAAGVNVRDLGRQIVDFADTAAIAAGLDLLVSADTSPAHVAGAIGRPCWVLAPHETDWRWRAVDGISAWYPGIRVIRASSERGWPDAIAEACARLGRFAEEREAV